MMMGIPVTLGGRKVQFLRPRDEMGEPSGYEIIGFDFADDRELRVNPRVRRILVPFLRPNQLFYCALHWPDASELAGVDSRAQDGELAEADLTQAVLAQLQSVTCLSCEADLRVLSVDASMDFLGDLTDRLRKHPFQQECPVCGSRIAMHIVEYLGMDTQL
jgi:hypothetical protein